MTAKKLPKCDCLNLCGDDPWIAKGKADYCDHHKAKEKAAALQESIAWKLVSDQLPDLNHVVLWFNFETAKRVNECYFDGTVWRFQDNDEIWVSSPVAWSRLPHGPRNTPWMKVRTE